MDSERIKELEDENKELTEKNLYLQKNMRGIKRYYSYSSKHI